MRGGMLADCGGTAAGAASNMAGAGVSAIIHGNSSSCAAVGRCDGLIRLRSVGHGWSEACVPFHRHQATALGGGYGHFWQAGAHASLEHIHELLAALETTRVPVCAHLRDELAQLAPESPNKRSGDGTAPQRHVRTRGQPMPHDRRTSRPSLFLRTTTFPSQFDMRAFPSVSKSWK